jgi:uncharacterized surface protein with fasciclin (FAS1) repeats
VRRHDEEGQHDETRHGRQRTDDEEMSAPLPLDGKALALAIALVALCALQPAFAANIVETAKADGHFTKLLEANQAAGTAALLPQPGPFTVFAPNDDAFAKVPADKLQALMTPAMKTMLKVTLGNHIVTGVLDMGAIEAAFGKGDAAAAMAANNMPLIFKMEGGKLTVNGAHVIKGPMTVDNGLVYVIDTVMMPAGPLQAHY